MTEFENYTEQAKMISREIEKELIALNIDWRDEVQLRQLAHEALTIKGNATLLGHVNDPREKALHVSLYGMIALMLRTMTESAGYGYEVHGSDSWKALAKALWQEKANLEGKAD